MHLMQCVYFSLTEQRASETRCVWIWSWQQKSGRRNTTKRKRKALTWRSSSINYRRSWVSGKLVRQRDGHHLTFDWSKLIWIIPLILSNFVVTCMSSMCCISGVCAPVMEKLSGIKQEERNDHAPSISNGSASENKQCDENISNLYKLLDDKVCISVFTSALMKHVRSSDH